MLDSSSQSDQSADSNTNAKIRIALVMKTLTNPFFIEMEKGARKAESEFGITLTVKTGAQETSIDQQIAIVEDLIKDGVDAIVIAPGSSTELIPVLKKAQDAGIKIVNIDNQLDPALSEKLELKNVPFISVDNINGGYLSAKYIADLLKAPTKAAIIEGITSAKNSKDRKEGAMKAFQECSNITSVVNSTANWKIDEAYTVTKKLLQENPDIGAIFCANDMMALGAIKYLSEARRSDVLVAGYDALSEAKQAIKTGELMVTIDQQANLQGYEGIQCALDLINGVPVEKEQIIDVKVITNTNLEE
jgi:ribose transport system substrate-binding protein